MRHLDSQDVRPAMPPGNGTHQHTSLLRETSLPNSPHGTFDPSHPLEGHFGYITSSVDTTPKFAHPPNVDSSVLLAPVGNTSRPRSHIPDEYAFSPVSTPAPHPIHYDSEEDTDVDVHDDRNTARVGPKYQVLDVDAIYGTEVSEDNATLLWDPDQMGEDELNTLLAQCEVADSTLKSIEQAHSASHSPTPFQAASQSPLHSSSESEMTHLSMSSGFSTSESYLPATPKVLPLEQMLQLIHDCQYIPSTTIEELRRHQIFGWSTHQSAFPVWAEDELERFEIGMADHPKRFDRIAAMVGTRTIGECVVQYYGWKHTDRYIKWSGQLVAGESVQEDEMVPMSRMLPNPSRKRKREVDTLMDSSERMYLEALGSLGEHSGLLQNIILDAPDILVEELQHQRQQQQQQLPPPHLSSKPDGITTVPEVIPSVPAPLEHTDTSVPAPTSLVASTSLPCISNSAAAAAASPKRPKLAEPDDRALLHSIDLASLGVPPTVDPATVFSNIFTPPEPTMDFFMHF